MAPPLFIVGTSRSGTSWVFELCASHPDMSMGYESKTPVEGATLYRQSSTSLDDHAAMAAFLAAVDSTIEDPTMPELPMRLHDDAVVDRAVEAHRRDPGWASICETVFRSIEDTSHWGNKLLRIELVPTLLELWPDACFLVLTRDPRGVMASQSKKFGHSVEYSATYWNTHANFIRSSLGLGPGEHDDAFFVTDLVEMASDPRPALEWSFSAVGLSTDPIDDLAARFPGDPARLDAWRETLDAELQQRIEQYCFEQMCSLGYPPELATGPQPIGRARMLLALAREHGGELLRDPSSIRRKQVGRRVMSALGRHG